MEGCFANHGISSILKWVNLGQALLRADPLLWHLKLGAEHELAMGFVDDQYAKGSALWNKPLLPTYSELVSFVRSAIHHPEIPDDLNYGSIVLECLDGGLQRIVRVKGGCDLAVLNYDDGRELESLEIDLADGLYVKGCRRITSASSGSLSWKLHHTYPAEVMLGAAVMLEEKGLREIVERVDQREVAIPAGASAVVEVGRFGSLKIVWAEAALIPLIREDGHLEWFDEMAPLAPGRYSCSFSYEWSDGEDGHVAWLRAYKRLNSDQTRLSLVPDVDWIPYAAGNGPEALEGDDDRLWSVRLHSGDVLSPMYLYEIVWGSIGLGTVAQYKPASSTQNLDLSLSRRFYEIFNDVRSRFPFTRLSVDYRRNTDWVIEMVDEGRAFGASDRNFSVSSTSYLTCQSMAIQMMLNALS